MLYAKRTDKFLGVIYVIHEPQKARCILGLELGTSIVGQELHFRLQEGRNHFLVLSILMELASTHIQRY